MGGISKMAILGGLQRELGRRMGSGTWVRKNLLCSCYFMEAVNIKGYYRQAKPTADLRLLVRTSPSGKYESKQTTSYLKSNKIK